MNPKHIIGKPNTKPIVANPKDKQCKLISNLLLPTPRFIFKNIKPKPIWAMGQHSAMIWCNWKFDIYLFQTCGGTVV